MTTSWGHTLKLYKYAFSPNFPFICISVDYGFVGELSVTAWYVPPNAALYTIVVSYLVVRNLGVA